MKNDFFSNNFILSYLQIPADAIEVVMTEHPSLEATLATLTMTNNLSRKTSASIREYLCYKAYLDAQEGFQEWFSHFYQGKPTPLDDLPSYATFTEKVAHDHKKAQYNAELERWKCTMQHHTKVIFKNPEHTNKNEYKKENERERMNQIFIC